MFSKILEYIKDDNLKINLYKDKVNIVNYKSILVFDDDKILVDCSSFNLLISGSNLIINKLYDHELLIKGNIDKIEYRWFMINYYVIQIKGKNPKRILSKLFKLGVDIYDIEYGKNVITFKTTYINYT